jgi:type II secretory pathway predicted ATPase ExeA
MQMRDGFINRSFNPMLFPKSIVLVGQRDLIDYMSQDRPEDKSCVKFSPFNIQSLPVSVPNFTKDQIRDLYKQHTDVSGQVFDNSSIEKIWTVTEGQPWLVNALARDIINNQLKNDYSVIIDKLLVETAISELFLLKQ